MGTTRPDGQDDVENTFEIEISQLGGRGADAELFAEVAQNLSARGQDLGLPFSAVDPTDPAAGCAVRAVDVSAQGMPLSPRGSFLVRGGVITALESNARTPIVGLPLASAHEAALFAATLLASAGQ